MAAKKTAKKSSKASKKTAKKAVKKSTAKKTAKKTTKKVAKKTTSKKTTSSKKPAAAKKKTTSSRSKKSTAASTAATLTAPTTARGLSDTAIDNTIQRAEKVQSTPVQHPIYDHPHHDSLAAGVIEFVLGMLTVLGIGHMYNGHTSRGLLHLFGYWILLLLQLLTILITQITNLFFIYLVLNFLIILWSSRAAYIGE